MAFRVWGFGVLTDYLSLLRSILMGRKYRSCLVPYIIFIDVARYPNALLTLAIPAGTCNIFEFTLLELCGPVSPERSEDLG